MPKPRIRIAALAEPRTEARVRAARDAATLEMQSVSRRITQGEADDVIAAIELALLDTPYPDLCVLSLDYAVGVAGTTVLDSWTCPVTGRVGTASGTARPTIDVDGITFDGTDDTVVWPWSTDFAAGSGIDIFMALTSSSATATRAAASVWGTPAASQSWIMLQNGVSVTTAGSIVVDELTTGTDRIAATPADVTSGAKVLFHGQFTGTQAIAYVNGSAGAPTAVAGATVPDGTTSLRLATHATGGNYGAMKLHGMLIYKTPGGLSTVQRQAVEAYCRTRFGTP